MSIYGNPVLLCPAQLALIELPQDVTAALNDTVSFRVRVSGPASVGVAYQWQYKSTGSWTNSPATGNKTDTLAVEATAARNGIQYRCVLTLANGASLTTNAATLTVAEESSDGDE